ncbi:putative hydrolase NIT3 [Zancudomyces culisetae]|uniref:Putative hydrolase NIT3 n=1 Tax=Zancudomyces culisetae TaxID=1213189 RepID=A0A1R1PW58_ZANCU|nr:putative hydrolase NIT3 [Zancudomyces culisetae]|eukprot:OMH85178.1 putative hydrolase NIT3 [Zancudomyces culisetae]
MYLMNLVTAWGKIGVGICYDMRFPELAMIAARKGCLAMIYPGAFNLTTGPMHWELLLRARATDNMIFVGGCSPARNLEATYHAWGHSTMVNPKGEVIAKAGAEESIVYAEIDTNDIQEIRSGIPIYNQRRFDLYPDVSQ